MNEIRAIDLFGGIGGFRKGLEQASDRFKFVWYCDKEQRAVDIYNKNFKETNKAKDITTIDTKEIPDHDILCAGFPCQSFSIAGYRHGFKDTRGTMFYEICRIVKDKRPSYLFLENVKGLLNHDEGKTFCTILYSLDELGYNVQWQVLNSKYCTGQNRERLFIFGCRRECGCPIVFPISNKDLYKNRSNPISWKWRSNKGDRRLKPSEGERLQGFPECWTEGNSYFQRLKVLGNAVTVNVIEVIGKKIIENVN